MASAFPESVVGLLPPESSEWLRDPALLAVLGAIDIGISQADVGFDGFVEVPVDQLLGPEGSLLTLVMLLSLLPEGFAELCGETQDGVVLMGEKFLSFMARQEAASRHAARRIFCRFRATRLMQSVDDIASLTAC